MEQRPLGQTGVVLSAVGFGCGRQAHLISAGNEAERMAAVRVALDGGITYFDTADSYGNGDADRNLARSFSELGVAPSLVTKVTLEPEDLGDPRSAALRRFDDCLQRLERDQVDVLMLHNQVWDHVEDGERGPVGAKLGLEHVFGPSGVAVAFHEAQAGGRARAIAFTAFGGDIPAINELIDSSVFGAFNVTFNLLNPSAAIAVGPEFGKKNFGRIIERGAARGLGIMAIAVMVQGALAVDSKHEDSDAAVVATALKHDDSLPSAATRYVLGKPGVSTAVLGFSSVEHVQLALAAEARGPLGAGAVAEIESAARG